MAIAALREKHIALRASLLKKELKHSTYTGKKKHVKNKPEAARKKTLLVSYSE